MELDEEHPLIDCLVLEFPGSTVTDAGLALLADMMDGGVGRVFDLVFIHKELDESVNVIDVAQLGGDMDLGLVALEGGHPGWIGPAEIATAGAHIDSGSSAGILVFERVWGMDDVAASESLASSGS